MILFIDDASGGGGDDYVTDGLLCYLDAANASSYPGSGEIWANLVAEPADGEAQTAYDYALGQGSGGVTDNPTFVGTAGVNGAHFYFEMGGYMTLAGALTPFLRDMHKGGTTFTVEAWIQLNGAGGQSGIVPIFDSGSSDQGGSDMSRGVLFADQGSVGGSGRNNIRVKRDSSAASALNVAADNVIPDGSIRAIAASVDGTGVDGSFLWQQGAYDQVSGADTFDGTLSSPGSSDAVNSSRIGARGDGASSKFEGRIYLLRIYNRNLSKSELDQNWNNDRGRFGL